MQLSFRLDFSSFYHHLLLLLITAFYFSLLNCCYWSICGRNSSTTQNVNFSRSLIKLTKVNANDYMKPHETHTCVHAYYWYYIVFYLLHSFCCGVCFCFCCSDCCCRFFINLYVCMFSKWSHKLKIYANAFTSKYMKSVMISWFCV